MNYDEWSAEPLNLLSPALVGTVQAALDLGLVCGLHYYYGGGRGTDPCVFADIETYLEAAKSSRAGDKFNLWSVAYLAQRGQLLMHKQGVAITPNELDELGALVQSPWLEFIAVGRLPGEPPEVCWGDYDFFERIEAFAERFAATGEFAVMPLSDELWNKSLVYAKRPNERGEVPLTGAY